MWFKTLQKNDEISKLKNANWNVSWIVQSSYHGDWDDLLDQVLLWL